MIPCCSPGVLYVNIASQVRFIVARYLLYKTALVASESEIHVEGEKEGERERDRELLHDHITLN